jgi:large subunit ribosomal protein L13
MEVIFNAEDCIAGRLASVTAKELLKGNRVYIVNAEGAVISGSPEYTIRLTKEKVDRGDPYHGPFYPKRPDLALRRVIRGMLPKQPRGREAIKRLRVFVGVPAELEGKESVRPEACQNRLRCKYIEVGKLSERMGSRKRW